MSANILKEVERFFSESEKTIKEAERAFPDRGVSVPAVNELRYAGYHLLRWERTKNEEELGKALNHAKRAYYDAAELLLCAYIAAVDERVKSIGDGNRDLLLRISADYAGLKKAVVEAKSFNDEFGGAADAEDKRDAFVKDCRRHTEGVKKYWEALDLCFEEIMAEVRRRAEASESEQRELRICKRRAIIGWIIGAVGLVIGVIGIFHS